MKKQLIVIIAVITLLAAVACVFAACGSKAELESPRNLDVINNNLVWDAVEGADGYLIYFNEDIGNRFYTTDTKLSLDNGNIQSSLKSGGENYMMVRAITLNADSKPDKMSDRSKLIFPFSRKLSAPTKLKRNDDTFSWRSVIGADDYKANVRKEGSTEVVRYNFAWKVGTSGVNATILDLPNGEMYYVRVVAVGEGYEDSDPSEEIPYDKTAIPADHTPDTGADDPVIDNSGKWAVTFDLNYEGGASFVEYALPGKPVATPATRTRPGYTFDGWYEDVYTLIPAGFTSKQSKFNITCNTTLYAKWVEDTTYVEPVDPVDPADPEEPSEPVVSGEEDATANAYLYVDGTNISWFAATGASISAKVTYSDGTVTTKTTKKAQFINGLYRWGVNKAKTVSSVIVTRTNVYGTAENVFELPLKQTPSYAAATPVFKLTTLNGNACVGNWTVYTEQTIDPVEPEKISYLYFDTTSIEWWDDAGAVTNVHIWYEDGSNNNWPGAVMTKDADTNIYKAKYYPERGVKGIIFTRNAPDKSTDDPTKPTEWGRVDVSGVAFNSQKPVYRLAAYTDYFIDGKWTALDESYEPENAVWFNIDYSAEAVSWFGDADANIYIHVWYTDNTSGTNYPGDLATKVGKRAFVKIDGDKALAGFVVTRCDPAKPFGEDAVWNKFEVTDFTWESGKDIYVYELSSADGAGKWEGAVEPEPEPEQPTPEDETYTVYFKNGGWKYVYAYAWKGDGASATQYLGAWPGSAMKASTTYAGWYEITVNAKAEKIVFNDTKNEIDGGKKTSDLVLNKNTPFYNDGWSATAVEAEVPVVVETATIYFKNTNNWTAVKAYAWSGSSPSAVEYLGAWGTTAMTAVDGKAGWFKVDVNVKAEKIIFSDNSGNQTADLTINYSKPYYNNAWYASMDAEIPTSYTVYYYNKDNWSAVKAYAWSGSSPSAVEYLGAWSGAVMTSDGNDWYKIEVSSSATNIIFNDGGSNQTSDLTIDPDNLYFKNGAWVAAKE